MTDISLRIDFDEVIDGIDGLKDCVDPGLDQIMRSFLLPIQNQMRTTVSTRWGPRTGVEYKRKGRTHKASAPGEPPATDSRHLLNHINADFGKGFIAIGVEDTRYAPILEDGRGPNIDPRPFLERSLEGFGDKIVNEFIRRCGAA